MAKTGTKTKARKPVAKPSPSKKKPVNLRTDERRLRVLEMWGRKDRHIAQILIEEGFETDAGAVPLSPHLKDAWQVKSADQMRRNVSNDKAWWRDRWRREAGKPAAPEDVAVQREEYVAALESDLDELADLMVDVATKSTAKAILHGEKRQTRALIAKARGIDQAIERPAEPPTKVPVIGVVIGTKNVSSDMKAILKKQGVKFDDEDEEK